MSKSETVIYEGPNREVYTCVRKGPDQPWEISFPVGDDRFYGNRLELWAHVEELIELHSGSDE